MPGPFAGLTEWIVGVVEAMGYPGIAVLLILENLFPPIPSELILPLAGFLAGQGRLVLLGVIAAATLGSVVGALVLYEVGRRLGEERVRRLVRANGHWLLIDEEDLQKAKEWFDHHSGRAVVLGRLAPGVRSLISIPAGVDHMPRAPFVIFTALGSGLWNTALVALGWALGDQWQQVEPYAGALGWVVAGVVLLAVTRFVWGRRSREAAPSR